MASTDLEVDLVYLWVNGSDPQWCNRKNYWLRFADSSERELAVPERWQDNDELKYSLRSVEAYAPWIHHIFIVTDRQYPAWLKRNHPKITIVDHRYFIPEEYLPVFCADAIESFVPYIPELGECFLFANDDMFFGRPVTEKLFYDDNGNPIVKVKKLAPRDFYKNAHLQDMYLDDIKLASRVRANILVSRKFSIPLNWEGGHVIDPYRKSFMLEALEEPDFKDSIQVSRTHRFRSPEAVQRVLFSLYDFARGRTTLKNVKEWKELIRVFAPCKIPFYLCNERDLAKCLRIRPEMFCYYVGDYYAALHQFFETYFPNKSSFEI